MLKIFLHSCHACLERDNSQMLTSLGHDVTGQFDIGSNQRPKIKGVTDHNSDYKDADLIVVHQTADFPTVARTYAEQGYPVIMTAFGQGSMPQHAKMAALTQENKKVKVVAYSKKDYEIYRLLGANVAMIRFCDWPDEYHAWQGNWPACLVMSNSIHKRGDACGWDILVALRATGLKIYVVGQDTQDMPYGLGMLPWDMLKVVMSQARCMLSLGTVPAPYLMHQMQGLMAGMPVVAYDNDAGIAGEGLAGIKVDKAVNRLESEVRELIEKPPDMKWSKISRQSAIDNFGDEKIKAQWKEVLNEFE